MDHTKRKEFIEGLRCARAVVRSLREKDPELDVPTLRKVYEELSKTIQTIKIKL